MAKEPRAGRVKTRLQPRFDPEQAASLATAALQDTVAAVAAARVRRRVLVLDGAPGPWLPTGFEVVPQRGAGLDERLQAAFEDVLGGAPSDGPALLVGMDTPQLTAELLTIDWTGLDAVLGPSRDGGYWAIGFRAPVAGAVLGIPMSTARTGAEQLRRLRGLGLRVGLLPPLQDVDTPADAAAVAALAPGTRFAAAHVRFTSLAAAGRSAGWSGSRVHPMELYEAALAGVDVDVLGDDGPRPLGTALWSAAANPVDELMLSRCEAPVLDVGCGPGRLVTALCERGVAALGVDISAVAVEHTAHRGGTALRRRVQDRLPREGHWGTVLLADGNVGIGGDPAALLSRCRDLLRPGGLLLAEADPDDDCDDRSSVVLQANDGRISYPLRWARVGSRPLAAMATALDLGIVEEWRTGGRVLLAVRSLRI